MWTQNTGGGRTESYLHQFLSDQPDLNLRSSGVQNQLDVCHTLYTFIVQIEK